MGTNLAVSSKQVGSGTAFGPTLVRSGAIQDSSSAGKGTTVNSVAGIVGLTVVLSILGLSFYLIGRYLL